MTNDEGRTRTERLWGWAKRHPYLAAIAGFFAFAFVFNAAHAVIDPEGHQASLDAAEERRAREATAEQEAERSAGDASRRADTADRQKGLHCLSGWSGANRSTVDQVKAQLRNPDSFEHVETKIYGNDGGEHGLWMTYRAENGFGGINVERIYARVDHESCNAWLLPSGPGSG